MEFLQEPIVLWELMVCIVVYDLTREAVDKFFRGL